jgi:hypothetical protein
MFFAYVFIFNWIIAVSRGPTQITFKEVFGKSTMGTRLSDETKKTPNTDQTPTLGTTYSAV